MKIFRLFVAFTLICFVLLPNTQAVVPAPDGGYPGGNTAEGTQALFNLISGVSNTANGHQALFNNTIGSSNTAEKFRALFNNTTGIQNATGFNTLFHNTTGEANTAHGREALFNNTTGANNTANGFQALFSNTSGHANTANGFEALFYNTGSLNTATGSLTLFNNTIGSLNTANGVNALFRNTTGTFNTATGNEALFFNTIGNDNTANGVSALANNTRGLQNTANGSLALVSNSIGNNNTAIGFRALVNNASGSSNIGVGVNAGSAVTSARNVICVGTGLTGANVSDRCYIDNIWQEPGGSQAVYVNAAGKLGALVSARRFKDEIKPMGEASEVIYRLKPVSFRYKPEVEATRLPAFGLIAEDVEKINPDLVIRDQEGKPYSVRYEQVKAMLLNEFLKEHRKVEQLTKDFGSKLAEQQKQIAMLTAGLQKVSAQLEASKFATGRIRRGGPVRQVVSNNQ